MVLLVETEKPTACGFLHRRKKELEDRLVEEETAARVKALIEQRVKEVMSSDAVQQTLQARLESERQALEEQVTVSCSLLSASCMKRSQLSRLFVSVVEASFCALNCRSPKTLNFVKLTDHSMQVEKELQEERLQAEEEERRAKEAIEQQKQELQQIEEQRQKEVGCICWPPVASGGYERSAAT